jgi:hypothetical protein
MLASFACSVAEMLFCTSLLAFVGAGKWSLHPYSHILVPYLCEQSNELAL